MSDVEDTRRRWEKAYKTALEYDSWGQVEEATEGYLRLSNAIANESVDNVLGLPFDTRADLKKMAACLKLRVKVHPEYRGVAGLGAWARGGHADADSDGDAGDLAGRLAGCQQEMETGKDQGVGVNNMKRLTSYYKGFMVSGEPFPLRIRNDAVTAAAAAPPVMDEDIKETEGGSLLPQAVSSRRGDELLSIKIDKWGFKEASGFIDPFLSVQVVNSKGELLESAQDTPVTNRIDGNYIMFGHTVHIQTPLNALPDGAAIVFEYKHYKPKKKKVSTRAWAFMEMSEMAQGPLALEIYKKPTDLKRKKIALLSVKQLFLHLELTITRVT